MITAVDKSIHPLYALSVALAVHEIECVVGEERVSAILEGEDQGIYRGNGLVVPKEQKARAREEAPEGPNKRRRSAVPVDLQRRI